jgi:hypothetical protein
MYEVPNFLSNAFDTAMEKARLQARRDYQDYWKNVKTFIIRPCYDCGRRCKVETEHANDKYYATCCKCWEDSMVAVAGADLADQMSVC